MVVEATVMMKTAVMTEAAAKATTSASVASTVTAPCGRFGGA